MISPYVAYHYPCAIEQCVPASLARTKVFIGQTLTMKAIDTRAMAARRPVRAPVILPDDAPSGGGSGGGALLGVEGAQLPHRRQVFQ
jgi:hypothetical protein